MARPAKTRAAAAPRAGARTAQSRRPAAADATTTADGEEGGLTLTDGLVIVTTLFLLLGLGTVDYYLGTRYGEGILF